MINYNENQKATFYLCAEVTNFSTRPLTIIEWNLLVKSLHDAKKEPKDIFTLTPSEIVHLLAKCTENQRKSISNKIAQRKNQTLISKELEDLTNREIKIVFRNEFPKKIQKIQNQMLPPFFYYVGDLQMFEKNTLGIVGSREAELSAINQVKEIVQEALPDTVIVSGGARGIDDTAVMTALELGGQAILYPTDGIGRIIKMKKYRDYVLNGQLTVLSHRAVEAGFLASYAMQRNRYIHTSSDKVIIASSAISNEKKKSGTWEGVVENHKHQWTPMYGLVGSAGVNELIRQGIITPYKPEFNLEIKLDHLIEQAIDSGIPQSEVKHILKKYAG